MAYTVEQINNIAIAIIDEISDNGTIDVNKTKEYRNRAPYLTDIGQKELADVGGLYYISEFENNDETELDKWKKYSLPANFKKVKDVLFEDADMQLPSIRHRQFGNVEIYFYFTNVGKARLLYIPIPDKITAITDELEVDESVATALAYYLAQFYANADQNTELEEVCRNKFNQLKISLSARTPSGITQTTDVYGLAGGGF